MQNMCEEQATVKQNFGVLTRDRQLENSLGWENSQTREFSRNFLGTKNGHGNILFDLGANFKLSAFFKIASRANRFTAPFVYK